MRITESIEKKVVVEEITAIMCDKCANFTDLDYANSVQHIEISFGYGSRYDGETLSFDLCEDCLMEFVNKFKIEPKRTGNEDWDYQEAEEITEETRPNILEPFRYV